MLSEQIYQVLRKEILSCKLAAGADLREQELASRFGVSKSPVREALQHLVFDELVSVAPRLGYRVASVSAGAAAQVFQFRQVLEIGCAADAVVSASDVQLASLDAYRTFSGSEDDFIAYNREFHCALAECSGNTRMARATCGLIDEMDRFIRLSVSAMRQRDPQKQVAEHVEIIEAVQKRSGKLAATLLRSHTSAAEKRIGKALQLAALQP